MTNTFTLAQACGHGIYWWRVAFDSLRKKGKSPPADAPIGPCRVNQPELRVVKKMKCKPSPGREKEREKEKQIEQ